MMNIKYFGLVLILFFISISCNKKSTYTYMNNAIIVGEDLRTCPCCGGLKLTFNNATNFKLIDTTIAQLGFAVTDTFPINVKIDWKIDTTNVCNYIIITKIEKQ